jgi:exosortase
MIAAESIRGRSTTFIWLVLPAAALAFCYADVFALLWRQWNDNDVFSHGPLIPFISAYLAWIRRDDLGAAGSRPRLLLGGATLLLGITALLAGRAAGIVGIQELSLLVSLSAVVLLVRGTEALAVLAFPIGYLLFMMPVWDFVTERLHWPFQLASAKLGARVLAALGVPVYLTGNQLQLPNITLEVARVCSGVNYLVAVLAIGVPLAYLSFRDWTRRIVLLAFGIVTAALFNSVRVALIGWMAYKDLSEVRHGPWHILQGLSVSIVGFVALFACWALLLRLRRYSNQRDAATHSVGAGGSVSGFGCVVATVVLALGGAARAVELKPLPADLNVQVPLRLGEWSAAAVRTAPTKPFPTKTWPDEIWREYSDSQGRSVTVYVGRYLWRRAPARPRPYWTDGSEGDATPVPVGNVMVGRTTLAGPPATRLLRWYQIGDRVTTSRVNAKLAGLRDLVLRRRPGPLVVIVAMHPDGPGADGTLGAFAQALMTTLGGDAP